MSTVFCWSLNQICTQQKRGDILSSFSCCSFMYVSRYIYLERCTGISARAALAKFSFSTAAVTSPTEKWEVRLCVCVFTISRGLGITCVPCRCSAVSSLAVPEAPSSQTPKENLSYADLGNEIKIGPARQRSPPRFSNFQQVGESGDADFCPQFIPRRYRV